MFICVLATLLGFFQLPGLHRSAQGPWVPAGGQLMVNLPYEQADASIVLMTHDGQVLEGPMLMPSGDAIDLMPLMPALANLDQAAYLQLLHGDEPTGAPYVLIPALSRRVPVMERVETPERGSWDRVSGWRDEGADDADAPSEHAGVIDVRRFDDAHGKTVLLVDNFQNATGLLEIVDTYGKKGKAMNFTVPTFGTGDSLSAVGLPAGLSLNAATGEISGTPVGGGASEVTFSVTGKGVTVTKKLPV